MKLTLIPDADLAIQRLLDADFLCPVVTVQSRIEKGLFSEKEFRSWFADFFGNLELDVKGPYICLHRYNHPCPCENPNPYLYEQAAADLSIDLKNSYTIGDSSQDVEAGLIIRCSGIVMYKYDREMIDEKRMGNMF